MKRRSSSSAPPAADRTTDYARRVVAGKIVAGELVVRAAKRHLADLVRARKPRAPIAWDVASAEAAIAFFPLLCHSKGKWAGQAFELAPWQAFIVGSLLGWKRPDGSRRFRRAWLEVARKNGKSTLAAGVALLLAFFDGEQGAEVYCAATKRDQARIVWSEAARMVKATPQLARRIRLPKNLDGPHTVANLAYPPTNSKLEPLSAEADTLDGLNIHGAIVDEVHAHKTRAVVDVLETATGARRQPLIVYTTTAGFDRESVAWELHRYAVDLVRGFDAGFADDAFFAFVATIDEGDDWKDPRAWAKANPNLGVSVYEDDLAGKARKAVKIPAEQNRFRRLHLNEWTHQATRWIALEAWDASAGPPINPEDLEGRRCYAGLDLASTTDLTALALLFPDPDGGYTALVFFFMPEAGLEDKAARDGVPYRLWADQGLLELTEGDVTDYDQVEARVAELAEDFEIVEVAFDPWNATALATRLAERGLKMVRFGQGLRDMAAPTKELERLILGRKFRHGGNPVLRAQAGNAAVREDSFGNRKIDKRKSTARVDGLVASVMAVGRATLPSEPAPGPSVYEERGLTIL